MHSRAAQQVETVGDARQNSGVQLQNKAVLREVQNEAQGLATPRQLKHEDSPPDAAQDVAELKDYVHISMDGAKTHSAVHQLI